MSAATGTLAGAQPAPGPGAAFDLVIKGGDVLDPSQQTINALMKLNLPAGVDIEIKL